MIVLSIGQTISSGRWRATAASIASPESTTSTVTRCPSSLSATSARWLRLLCAEVTKRMRSECAASGGAGASARAGSVMESRREDVIADGCIPQGARGAGADTRGAGRFRDAPR